MTGDDEGGGMDESSVSAKIIEIFARFKNTDAATITPETTFEDLGFDSLDGLNLIFEIEEEFDISVPDDEAQKMRSVGQVIDGVRYLLSEKGNLNN